MRNTKRYCDLVLSALHSNSSLVQATNPQCFTGVMPKLLSNSRMHYSHKYHTGTALLTRWYDDVSDDPQKDLEEAGQRAMRDPAAMLLVSQGMPLGVALKSHLSLDELRAMDVMAMRVSDEPSWEESAVEAACQAASQYQKTGDTNYLGFDAKSLSSAELLRSAADHWKGLEQGSKPEVQAEAKAEVETALEGVAESAIQPITAAEQEVVGSGMEPVTAAEHEVVETMSAVIKDNESAQRDAWGTTRESPAEIAARIVESNAGSEVEESDSGDEVAEESSKGDASMALEADEMKYSTLEAMSKDIRALDEVFEMLAVVPWLDDWDVREKELKGIATVGLMGTLEEVGFQIGSQIKRIWAGERDSDALLEGTSPKEQSALISILFHTKQLEETHGPPENVLAGGK